MRPICGDMNRSKEVREERKRMFGNQIGVSYPIIILILKVGNFISSTSIDDKRVKKSGISIASAKPSNSRPHIPIIFFIF